MALEINSLHPAGEQSSLKLTLKKSASPSLSGRERMLFTERLALLLETGGGLRPSLETLKAQAETPQFASMIDVMISDVLAGKPFSQALSRHPHGFSSTYVNLVAAGEQGGFLHRVLNQLHAMEEKREKLRSVLTLAFSYPAFLLFFSVGVVIFILAVVFPKFATLFASIYDQLPLTTRFLMGLSELIQRFWPLLFAAAALLLFLLVRWWRSPAGKQTIGWLKLNLPGLRTIFTQVYLVQVLRVMGLSLANGVVVLDALKACREVVDNPAFSPFLATLEKHVTEGRGLAAGFEESPLVPVMVRQMIRTGEESGQLALIMDRVATFYEKETEKRVAIIAKIVEPLMLLVMGAVVGILVSSLILPIFKLSRAVH